MNKILRNIAFVLGLLSGITARAQQPGSPVFTPTTNLEAQKLAPGIISTDENSEFDLAFTPDGSRIYFTRRAPEQKQQIYYSDYENGGWSMPLLAPFSTDRDETPSITPDGRYFFFGSERTIPGMPNLGNFDMNIWMMEKTPQGWGKPLPLPAPINEVQQEGEEWPSSNNNLLYTVDNTTFYYTTMPRGEEAIQLFRTRFDGTAFSAPQPVTGLFQDARFWVYSAVLSPDGQFLVFNSYGAPGGAGGEDLFVAKRKGSGWTQAKPMGSLVNSKDEESSPRFSPDGKHFFFSRAENLGNYEYGVWNIMVVETAALQLEKLFP